LLLLLQRNLVRLKCIGLGGEIASNVRTRWENVANQDHVWVLKPPTALMKAHLSECTQETNVPSLARYQNVWKILRKNMNKIEDKEIYFAIICILLNFLCLFLVSLYFRLYRFLCKFIKLTRTFQNKAHKNKMYKV